MPLQALLAASKETQKSESARFRPVTVQRKCSCGGGCSGCQAEELREGSHNYQTKLAVNAVGDRYEREADRVADAIVATRGHSPVNTAVPSRHPFAEMRFVQRKATDKTHEPKTEKEKKETAGPAAPFLVKPVLQAKSAGAPGAQAPSRAAQIEQRIGARENLGMRLPTTTLQFMESRFQSDFADVRIHTDGEAHSLNRDLNAYAFTSGRHIFFAPGKFSPGSEAGDRLLAHELTHVLQQASARGIDRSKRVQRTGAIYHHEIEKRLVDYNSEDLLAEVAMPGGVRPGDKSRGVFDFDKLNQRGYADLYRSRRENKVVPGIKIQEADEHDDPLGIGDPPLRYLNLEHKKIITGKSAGKGYIASPRWKTRTPTYTWDNNPGFPREFEVADIKPLFARDIDFTRPDFGTGTLQVDNYIEGLQAVVERFHKDSNLPPSSTSGSPMPIGSTKPTTGKASTPPGSGIRIPPEMDYGQIDSQPATPNKRFQIVEKAPDKRLWVYSIKPGLLNYFLLPNTKVPESYKEEINDQWSKLERLLDPLKKPHPQSIPLSATQEKNDPAPNPNPVVVQREEIDESGDDVQPEASLAGGWREQWNKWKAERKQWRGTAETPGSAIQFLKHSALVPRARLEVDRSLSLPFAESNVPDEAKKLRQLERWAGPQGSVIGFARFRFGGLIDKVETLFEKVRGKFGSFISSVKVSSEGTGGWIKKALEVIGRAIVYILKELARAAYSIAADCVNGIVDAVINDFFAEALDWLKPIVGPIWDVLAKIESLHKEIEEKYAPLIDDVQAVLSAFAEYQTWANLVSDIEWAIRLLIEAISCGVPPALGCLWGVLSQFGFSIAAGMAIATNLFERKIARPAARTLVDAIAGNTIRRFISDIVSEIGLGSVVRGVKECGPAPRPGGPRFDRDVKFDPDDPELKATKFDLELKYGDRMVKDLQNAFGSAGKPATPKEIDDLVSSIQASGLTAEEFRRKLKKEGGKYDLAQAQQVVATSGSGPGSKDSKAAAEIPTIDISAQPAAGSGGTTASRYGILAMAEAGHQPTPDRKPISITLFLLRDGQRVAVLTNVTAIVTAREAYEDGEVAVTYSIVSRKTFPFDHARFILPDTAAGIVGQ